MLKSHLLRGTFHGAPTPPPHGCAVPPHPDVYTEPPTLGRAQDSGSQNQQAVREDPPSPGDRGYNVFRNLVLHGLKDEEDFEVVYKGLSRLLNNLHRSRNTYIPGAATEVGGGTGTLLFVRSLVCCDVSCFLGCFRRVGFKSGVGTDGEQ